MKFIGFSALIFLLGCQTSLLGNRMKTKLCSPEKIALSSGDFKVQVSRYKSGEEESDRSILIMPPTGGATILDRNFARHFCVSGFDVMILEEWTRENFAIDLGIHHRLYSAGQKAIDLVISQTGSRFIGMLGTSVGATHAAVAANLTERLDAVFIIVGGAPIPGIIVDSDQKAMEDLRQKRFEKFAFKSRREYLAALDKEFPLDPFKTAPLYKKKDLGMFLSTTDTTVPAQYQTALRDLWKPKKVIEVSSNHFISIIKAWLWHQKEIQKFFEESAKTSSPVES